MVLSQSTPAALIADQLAGRLGEGAAHDRSGRLHLHCDFDGTLVPIASDPQHCHLDSALGQLLQRLVDHPAVEVAIISGRSLDDLRKRLGVRGLALAGNHGLEIAARDRRWCHPGALALRPQLQQLAGEARSLLNGIPGAVVEDKGLSLSLHSRRVPRAWRLQLQKCLAQLQAAHGDRSQLAFHPGLEVLEIRPALGWTKASAARWLCGRSSQPSGFFYAGDDRTDEDVFRAFPEGITVKIGTAATPTAALYRLDSPAQLSTLLMQLWIRIAGMS